MGTYNKERSFATQHRKPGQAVVSIKFSTMVCEAMGPMLKHVDQIGPPMEA